MNNRPLRTVVATALVLLTLVAVLVVIAGVSLLLGVFEGFDAGTQAALEWGAGLVILTAILGSLGWLGHRYYQGLAPDAEPGRVLRDPLPPDGYLDDDGAYVDGTGQVIRSVHKATACSTREHCTIHRPSDHAMRSWPTHFRPMSYKMERMCPHDVGHPDPDHLAWAQEQEDNDLAPENFTRNESIHACDGCCSYPSLTPEERAARARQGMVDKLHEEAFEANVRASVELDLGPNAPKSIEGVPGAEE